MFQIDKSSVGYIIVGSETITDKSKGVFTALSQLFDKNNEIFGAECIGACYAGTSALFNAIDWIYANWQRESWSLSYYCFSDPRTFYIFCLLLRKVCRCRYGRHCSVCSGTS